MEKFIKGSSKPKQEQTIENRIKEEVLRKQELRLDGSLINGAKISNLEIKKATPCDNPDSNYMYKGCGTIKIAKFVGGSDKPDYQEFPNCDISGFALIEDKEVKLINKTSIDSGLLKQLIK